MTSIIPPGGLGEVKTTTRHGIHLQVFPARLDPSGDPQHALYRVQRAPDSTGTPGSPSTADVLDIGNIPGGRRLTLVDYLPNDGKKRFYRALAYSYGYANSPPTGWVDAEPDVVIQGTEDPVQVGTVFSNTLLVSDTTGVVAKEITLNHAAFVPDNDSTPFDRTVERLTPGSTTTAQQLYHAPISLPVGSRVTQLQARLYRTTGSETCSATLYQRTTSASTGGVQSFTLATVASTGTGWLEPTDASTGVVLSVSHTMTLVMNQNSAHGCRFNWAKVTYEVATVGESL